VAAPPLGSPCGGPVTYPGDTKMLIKSSKGRRGWTLNFVFFWLLIINVRIIFLSNRTRTL